VAEVNNSQRDGLMQMGEYSGPVNFEPASVAGGSPVEASSETPSKYRVEGEVTKEKISKTNDFQQAGAKYRSLSKKDQEHLIDNLIADLTPIDKPIQQRVITNLTKADPELGKAIAEGLKL
jgi:catalase